MAQCFGLAAPRTHESRSLKTGRLAVTELVSDAPTDRPTASIGQEDAYLIGVQLRDCPDHELWFDGRPARPPAYRAGEVCFYDLRRDPVAFIRNGYHSLQFYLPLSALAQVTEDQGGHRLDELRHRFAEGHDDPIMHHLAMAILPAFAGDARVDGLFLDHVLQAVLAHVTARYGEGRPADRGALAAWQVTRAKEMMRTRLSGEVSLDELAKACGLSVGHFARAFRRSTGVPPHRWLVRLRLELAAGMLRDNRLPLSRIAADCGFSDQSHFTRAFSRAMGMAPGAWRRLHGAPRLVGRRETEAGTI